MLRALVHLASGRAQSDASGTEANSYEYGSISRSVLTDSDALLTVYGVGEEGARDMMTAVVELGYTSSVRFLQPGLLLQVPFYVNKVLIVTKNVNVLS